MLVGQLFGYGSLLCITARLRSQLSTPSQHPPFLKHLGRVPGVGLSGGLIRTPHAWV